MDGFYCGVQSGPPLPDLGLEVPCCAGSALFGPERCTCWQPQFDLEQQPSKTGEPCPRTSMCDDCAFRPGSPERTGNPDYANSGQDDLDKLIAGDDPFYCHQGIRRQVALVHPNGARISSPSSAYRPAICDGVPRKADGAPADICAGWLALHLAAKTTGFKIAP